MIIVIKRLFYRIGKIQVIAVENHITVKYTKMDI